MKRATSPGFLESVANHPRVRPWVGGDGESEFRVSPERWAQTVALEWPEGGIVFEQYAPGAYLAHWVFLPKTRDVVAKGKQAVGYLFTHTDASVIAGATPSHLRHALKAAYAVGMKHVEDADGVTFTALTRADWINSKDA